jgi:putative ABC transport system permease protein
VSSLLVGPGYFDVLGLRALRGRTFSATDGARSLPVAIVNERFASVHFRNEDPIGRRIRVIDRDPNTPEREWLTIVGLVANVRQRTTEDGGFDAVVYVPYAANPIASATILVRTDRGIAPVASQIRAQIRALDADLPLYDVMTVDDRLAQAVWERQVFGLMLGLFSAIALTLAAVGLYGVTAYSVSRRTREIGIRVALGARIADVYWVVTRRASLQLAIGLVLGLLGSAGVGVAVQNLQSEVSPLDPVTFMTVVVILITVALVACLVPARRATRLDPVAALRSE